MNIIFLRHGESLANTDHKFYNNDKTNFLSMKGVLEVKLATYAIAEYLSFGKKIDRSFSSGLTRAAQTASIVLHGIDVDASRIVTDDRLNEWCHEATEHKEWHLSEPPEVFRKRIESFYNEFLMPVMDKDVTYFITSHHYTMQCLFDTIGVKTGIISKYSKLDPNNVTIKNAIPYYYDSTEKSMPSILI